MNRAGRKRTHFAGESCQRCGKNRKTYSNTDKGQRNLRARCDSLPEEPAAVSRGELDAVRLAADAAVGMSLQGVVRATWPCGACEGEDAVEYDVATPGVVTVVRRHRCGGRWGAWMRRVWQAVRGG